MNRAVINSCYLALWIVISLTVMSCGDFHRPTSDDCCADISADQVLDEPAVAYEPEDVHIELRFDNRAVVAAIAGEDQRITYFNSYDGGNTWRRDAFYQELRVWQTHVRRDGEVIPWNPNPADASVRYRTIYFPEGKSFHERSTDDGKNWIRMKGSILGCNTAIEKGGTYFYHPREPLTLYHNAFLLGPKPGLFGMFVSVDGGDTFRFMYESDLLNALAISQSNPEVMYGAGPAGSLLKSTDGGNLWDLVGQNDLIRKTRVRKREEGTRTSGKAFDQWPTDIDDIAIDPLDINRVYVATSKGLLRSENGGETWCILNTGITKARAIHSLVIVPAQPDVVFVGTYKGLMRSVDRGCHWEWIDVLSRVQK